MNNRYTRKDWKAITWDQDYIQSFSAEVQCPYYLNEQEVQALLTTMEMMSWSTRWYSPTGQELDRRWIRELASGLSDKLMREDDCPSDPCEDGCIDYLPNTGFIRYEPNDPFRTPLLVPPGYTYTPWYTNPTIPLPGVIPTDAMVNQLSVLAPALPLSGFPRFSFEFDGRGEVEIELVNVPAGGFCVVVLDENLFNVKIVNTSSNLLDIVSIAGLLAALGIDTEDANVVDTDVVEIEVENVGHHRIDVTFLPNLGGETILGFGGGLRRITLCGFSEVQQEMYLQRQSPEDECLIEQSTDGGITWQEAWRMDNCCCDDQATQTRVVDGIIEESTDGGETWHEIENDPRFNGLRLPPRTGGDPKCDSAQSVVDMIENHFEELAADVGLGASVTVVIAAVIALLAVVVSLGTFTPLIVPLAGALFYAGSAAITAEMDAAVYEELLCLVYCNSEDDGSYTKTGWQSLVNGIIASDELPTLPKTLLRDYVRLLGSVGLSNAASFNPTADGDCEACNCIDGCANNYEVIYGTYLGKFDGYDRYETELVSGKQMLLLRSIDINNCCQLYDWHVVGTNPGIINKRVNCGSENNPPSGTTNNWNLLSCSNYMSSESVNPLGTPYTVDIFFVECP